MLLNVAAFVPLGLLLPLAARWFRRWYLTLPTGFLVSLAVESLQYFTRRGTFDVDDLFTNTLGCALGYCLVMAAVLLLSRQRPRRWLPYLACPAAFCLAVGGIFAAYALKPYGNLSLAPAYRVDLSGISWTLDCDLSDDAGTAMVYRAPRLDRRSCDDFGAAFAQAHGVTFPDAYYYDDLTVFSNHSTGDFLSVDYRNGSYTYRLGEPMAVAATEDGLRAALEALDIYLPDGAVFTQEGRLATFTASLEPVGAQIYDGAVICRVEDGAITEVDNFLVALTPCREAPILTQAQAYEQLQAGWFAPAEPLAALQPAAVTVADCTLTYRVDTKGYYQPMYCFTLTGDSLELDQALIPALS